MKNAVQMYRICIIFVNHYISFEHYISQHCKLYFYVSKGQLIILNISSIEVSQQASGDGRDNLAASNGQVWVNKFLAGQSKDTLDSLCN
jgi:hypothetical protein